ncbi:MAG: hypothetical protein QNJ77_08835, partial [Acidimicrobiia bacterium]|nr:hypothetical protein [Acidimicrobiia bacterium]
AAIRAIDGTGPETALVSAICEQLHIEMTTGRPVARDIVTTAHSQPPAQLGQLAPVVVAACDEQDEVALRLVETAAGHLADTAAAAARDVQPAVVVLAGSLLTKAAPIRRLVRATLSERWPGTPITEAASGEAGAAALAISRHQGACIDDKTLGRLRGETPVAT